MDKGCGSPYSGGLFLCHSPTASIPKRELYDEGLGIGQTHEERLAKYGLSMKAVPKPSHTSTAGLIMMPKGRHRVHIKDIPDDDPIFV